jgi:hypothetical protein
MQDETTLAAHVSVAPMSKFDKNAANYATSAVHAKGAISGRIVDILALHPPVDTARHRANSGRYGVCGGRLDRVARTGTRR